MVNDNSSLEDLVDQIMDNIKKMPHGEMTDENSREYIRKWLSKHNYLWDIIKLAHFQVRTYWNTEVTLEEMDEYLTLWHEENLKSEAEIRTFEKEQGKPFPERPKK